MSETFSGPIDYLAVEFPGASVTGEGFELIDGLIRNGTIRVLDLEFVLKDTDGYVRSVALGDVDNAGSIDIERWDGASSGLLDQSDIDKVGAAIDPGSLAGILVYENVWAVPLVTVTCRPAVTYPPVSRRSLRPLPRSRRRPLSRVPRSTMSSISWPGSAASGTVACSPTPSSRRRRPEYSTADAETAIVNEIRDLGGRLDRRVERVEVRIAELDACVDALAPGAPQ